MAKKKAAQPAGEQDMALVDALRVEGNERLLLMRFNPDTGRPAILKTLGEGENDLDWIQQQYGGGDFWVRTQDVATGHFVQGKQARFQIEGPARMPAAPRAAAAGDAGGSSTLTQLRELLELQRLIMPPAAPQRDPLEIAVTLAGLLKPSKDPLELVAAVIAMMPKPGGAQRDPIELLRDLQALQKEMKPENGELSGVDPTFAAIGAPLIKLVDRALSLPAGRHLPPGAALPAAPPATPAPTSAAPAETGNVSADVEGEGVFSLLNAVRPYVAQLAPLAAQNKNAELYADVILDQLPDAVFAILQEKLSETAAVEKLEADLAACEPAVAQYRDWFHQLLMAIREGLREPESGAVADVPGNEQ